MCNEPLKYFKNNFEIFEKYFLIIKVLYILRISLCVTIPLDIETCYLFINLANNGFIIFWNFIEFCLNKIPEKYSGTESNIHDRYLLQ